VLGHAGGAALADGARVDPAAARVDRVDRRARGEGVHHLRLADRDVRVLAVDVDDLVRLVPDHRDLPGVAGGHPWPEHAPGGAVRDRDRRPPGLPHAARHRAPDALRYRPPAAARVLLARAGPMVIPAG